MVQRNPGKSPINELLLDRFRTVSSFSVESPTTAFREHQFCRIDGRGGDDGGSLSSVCNGFTWRLRIKSYEEVSGVGINLIHQNQ